VKQIPLDLAPVEATGFDNFVITDTNRIAVTALRAWPDWPAPTLLEWGTEMPDLRSRLSNTPVMVMDDYDEGVLEPILRQLFEARGRVITKDLVGYLLRYQDRDVGALRKLVIALDKAALADNADLTKTFASRYLSDRLERDLFASPIEE